MVPPSGHLFMWLHRLLYGENFKHLFRNHWANWSQISYMNPQSIWGTEAYLPMPGQHSHSHFDLGVHVPLGFSILGYRSLFEAVFQLPARPARISHKIRRGRKVLKDVRPPDACFFPGSEFRFQKNTPVPSFITGYHRTGNCLL